MVCIYRYWSGIYHLFDSFGRWYGKVKCGYGIEMFDCLIVSAKKSVNGREWRASRAARRCALRARVRVSWAAPRAESRVAGWCMCVLHPPPRFVASQTSDAWV